MPDKKDKEAYEAAIKKYFPPLPPIGPEFKPAPGPEGKALTLADLQQLAHANSPLLRQAAANLEAARGNMVQVGLYPNPSFGYQGQTHGPGGGPNYGPSLQQTFPTMNKLGLARSAAEMDLKNAELAYRRAETDLMANVRTGYFSLLVAIESIRQNRALVDLTDEMYKVMVDQLKGGELATYEPMQVGVFSSQARTSLITARNSYTLAWKQLASTLGQPGKPPTEVAGNIRQMPLPQYRYDTVLAHVLSNHTDVGTAYNDICKMRLLLRLAEVQPVPDPTVGAGLIQDISPPGPNALVFQGNINLPIPIWNLNQGAIYAAKANLAAANEEPLQARSNLTARSPTLSGGIPRTPTLWSCISRTSYPCRCRLTARPLTAITAVRLATCSIWILSARNKTW